MTIEAHSLPSAAETPRSAPGIALAFDEGPGAGLGHRRRMEAVLAELTRRGYEGVLLPLGAAGTVNADAVFVDSYRVRADDASRIRARVVVALDDLDRDLAVDLVVDPSPGAIGAAHRRARRVLAGAAYALVPPARPTPAEAAVDAPVDRVLVTVGAADASGTGALIAEALARAFVDIELRLVVGPWTELEGGTGASAPPANVVILRAPDGLTDELARASIVVTAGGVTLLESCLLGRPTVALALAANQRQAVNGLAREGAVIAAAPEHVVAAVASLVDDRARRAALSAAARIALDGKGAARVADAFEHLLVRR